MFHRSIVHKYIQLLAGFFTDWFILISSYRMPGVDCFQYRHCNAPPSDGQYNREMLMRQASEQDSYPNESPKEYFDLSAPSIAK